MLNLIVLLEIPIKNLKNALTELKEQGMVDLVLDLRGMEGGFVDIATQIADEFLDEDKLIVFTKNNKKKSTNLMPLAKGILKRVVCIFSSMKTLHRPRKLLRVLCRTMIKELS